MKNWLVEFEDEGKSFELVSEGWKDEPVTICVTAEMCIQIDTHTLILDKARVAFQGNITSVIEVPDAYLQEKQFQGFIGKPLIAVPEGNPPAGYAWCTKCNGSALDISGDSGGSCPHCFNGLVQS